MFKQTIGTRASILISKNHVSVTHFYQINQHFEIITGYTHSRASLLLKAKATVNLRFLALPLFHAVWADLLQALQYLVYHSFRQVSSTLYSKKKGNLYRCAIESIQPGMHHNLVWQQLSSRLQEIAEGLCI